MDGNNLNAISTRFSHGVAKEAKGIKCCWLRSWREEPCVVDDDDDDDES